MVPIPLDITLYSPSTFPWLNVSFNFPGLTPIAPQVSGSTSIVGSLISGTSPVLIGGSLGAKSSRVVNLQPLE